MQISMSPRKLIDVIIRIFAFYKISMQIVYLPRLLWVLHDPAWRDPDLRMRNFWDLAAQDALNFLLFGLLFYFSDRIASRVLDEDQEEVLSGDLHGLLVPALQITGIVFCVNAVAELLPVLWSCYQATLPDAPRGLDLKFWQNLWSVFVAGLVGFLLFRQPAWLAVRMKRFAGQN
jgi:hypothetical protein